jgi:hypothetical protein
MLRIRLLALGLAGCIGHADLGDELTESAMPAEAGGNPPRIPDASTSSNLKVQVTAEPTEESCGACLLLTASTSGGEPPYTFAWRDLTSTDGSVLVCPGVDPVSYAVDVADRRGNGTSGHIRVASRLSCSLDAGVDEEEFVPSPKQICIKNGTFEGTPAVNINGAGFSAPWWTLCPNPGGGTNTPDLLASMTTPPGAPPFPAVPHGSTLAGAAEKEALSQALCEGVYPGEKLAFEIELFRLPLGGGVLPETESAFVRVWGGNSADCSRRELLWASPPLTDKWQRFCARVEPQHFTDLITLESASDESLGSVTYVLMDDVYPVDGCP